MRPSGYKMEGLRNPVDETPRVVGQGCQGACGWEGSITD